MDSQNQPHEPGGARWCLVTERKLAAILSADVVGYSRLMAEDEDETVHILGDYREQVDLLVRQHRGRLVDFTGDNFLAEFPTALDATQCAIEIQRVLASRNADLPPDRRMEFRIGLHLGDIRVEGERIFGDGVNVAARLESMASAGGICISATVHEQVRNKLQVGYDDLGDQTVKNIPDRVHVYKVRLEEPRAAGANQPTARLQLRWGAAALAAAASLTVAGWWILAPSPPPETSEIRSIAVLPLENLSGDPEQEYFVDGMTEALIAALAKIGSLRVISRTSVMQYKGVRKPLPQIARELDVDAIVEGSVVRAGDRVRITAQLVHAPTDRHLWAESYQRDLQDVLAVQGEVARAIAGEVRIKLTAQEEARLTRARPVNPAAHEAYLRGRARTTLSSREGWRAATAYFEQAIEIDPDYALGYTGLADAYASAALFGEAPPAELLPEARAAAQRALELDDGLPEAHLSLGAVAMYHDWDFRAAERSFRRALELNPSSPLAHLWLAFCLSLTGRSDESLVEADLATRLNPLSAPYRAGPGLLHRYARDYETAEKLNREALALDPDYGLALSSLATIYSLTGRHDEAIAQAEPLWRESPQLLGFAYARAGRREEALAVLEELKTRSQERYVSGADLAMVYAGLGKHDEAFEWLEKAYEQQAINLIFLNTPSWDPLRSDPRYDDLLRRIGFPES